MKTRLKAIIVDDELASRSRLSILLNAYPEVLLVGYAGSVAEASALLKRVEADVVFLDMEMPGGFGFGLRPWLGRQTRTVVVTAYPDFALKAFEYGAVDYLIKPVDPDRLAIAMERIIELENRQMSRDSERIELNSADGETLLVPIETILWIEAQQNYSLLHLEREVSPRVFRRTMASWESLLPPNKFAKIGRSEIIHLARVESIRFGMRTETQVRFIGAEKIMLLGRASAMRLRSAMSEGNWLST